MTSEVEERPKLVTAGYGRHRSQWVKRESQEILKTYVCGICLLIYDVFPVA